jgi:hypothetical protein
MDVGIQIVWWIGLVGALLLTLVILKEAATLLGTLRDILVLAEATRQAADGIKNSLNAVDDLAGLQEVSIELRDVSRGLPGLSAVLVDRLGNLKPGRKGG